MFNLIVLYRIPSFVFHFILDLFLFINKLFFVFTLIIVEYLSDFVHLSLYYLLNIFLLTSTSGNTSNFHQVFQILCRVQADILFDFN